MRLWPFGITLQQCLDDVVTAVDLPACSYLPECIIDHVLKIGARGPELPSVEERFAGRKLLQNFVQRQIFQDYSLSCREALFLASPPYDSSNRM